MKFVHRLGYYFGGFSLGIIFLIFFFSGKKASCNYFPDARVLENIRSKVIVYSEAAEDVLRQFQIDTAEINYILINGDIDFGRSDTNAEPCNLYLVTGNPAERDFEMQIENCDSIATIQKIEILN